MFSMVNRIYLRRSPSPVVNRSARPPIVNRSARRKHIVEKMLIQFSSLMDTYDEDSSEYEHLEREAISLNMWAIDQKILDE